MSNISVDTVWAYTNGQLPANADSTLIDYNTGMIAVLPQGACIRNIWFHLTGSGGNPQYLTGGATLKFGIAGQNEYIVPASAGLSTDNINSNDVMYTPAGLKLSVPVNSNIVANPGNASVAGGGFDVFIEYNLYTDI